jgi:hypothetical protein
MTIIAEVAKELLGMFIADVRLTAAILVLVAIVAILAVVWPVEPVLGGGVLLLDPSLFSQTRSCGEHDSGGSYDYR